MIRDSFPNGALEWQRAFPLVLSFFFLTFIYPKSLAFSSVGVVPCNKLYVASTHSQRGPRSCPCPFALPAFLARLPQRSTVFLGRPRALSTSSFSPRFLHVTASVQRIASWSAIWSCCSSLWPWVGIPFRTMELCCIPIDVHKRRYAVLLRPWSRPLPSRPSFELSSGGRWCHLEKKTEGRRRRSWIHAIETKKGVYIQCLCITCIKSRPRPASERRGRARNRVRIPNLSSPTCNMSLLTNFQQISPIWKSVENSGQMNSTIIYWKRRNDTTRWLNIFGQAFL